MRCSGMWTHCTFTDMCFACKQMSFSFYAFILIKFHCIIVNRVLVHVVNGDSEDPVGDFRAINQELELFNPALAQKTQVVVVNKVDIPAVRERLEELTEQLRWVAGHSRVMGVSAATGERVKELMRRVHRLVGASQVLTDGTLSDSVTPPLVTGASGTNTNTAVSATAGSSNRKIAASSVQELFTPEEERVSFEEDSGDNSFVVQTDARWPGQFRVVGRRIEKVRTVCTHELSVLSFLCKLIQYVFYFRDSSILSCTVV